MKRLTSILLFVFVCAYLQAQFRIGPKIGVHTHDLSILDKTGLDQRIKGADLGYHIGLDLKAQLGMITILPSIIFNHIQAEYLASPISESTLQISQYNAEIPLLLGIKCSIFNVYGGLSSMFRLGGNKQFEGLDDLRDRYIPATLSGQLGIRINVRKMFLECKYDHNLFSYKPLLNGAPIQLIDSHSRTIVSLGKYF